MLIRYDDISLTYQVGQSVTHVSQSSGDSGLGFDPGQFEVIDTGQVINVWVDMISD